MTLPQYNRHECLFNGHRVYLTPSQRVIVACLLMRGPVPTPASLLVEVLYDHREDGGPLRTVDTAKAFVWQIKRKMPGSIASRTGIGYTLAQFAA